MARIAIISTSPLTVGVRPVSIGDRLTVDQDTADRYVDAGLAVALGDQPASPAEKSAKTRAAKTPAALTTTTEAD